MCKLEHCYSSNTKYAQLNTKMFLRNVKIKNTLWYIYNTGQIIILIEIIVDSKVTKLLSIVKNRRLPAFSKLQNRKLKILKSYILLKFTKMLSKNST